MTEQSRVIVPVLLFALAIGIAALIMSQPNAEQADSDQNVPGESSEGTQAIGPAVTTPEPDDEEDNEPVAGYPHEDLDAVLWVRTSAEYVAIASQTYRGARAQVGDALMDRTRTACLEQQEMIDSGTKDAAWLASLPPAVVMDVDETVLNNTDYQVGLIEEDIQYDGDHWNKFCRKKVSTAIPGAVEFVEACRAAGVAVLFVTNREHEVEGVTRENLIAVGLMREDDPDLIYTKKEKEEWTSDKATRRIHVSMEYRILMLVGDDLNDFVSLESNPSDDMRRAAIDTYQAWIGERWFVLPNPNYGGWEATLYDFEFGAEKERKRELKRQRLHDTAETPQDDPQQDDSSPEQETSDDAPADESENDASDGESS